MRTEILLKVKNKAEIALVLDALKAYSSTTVDSTNKATNGWELLISGSQDDLRELRCTEIGAKAKIKNAKGEFYSPLQSMNGWARAVTPLPSRVNYGGAFSKSKK